MPIASLPASTGKLVLALLTVAALASCTPVGTDSDSSAGQGMSDSPAGGSAADEFANGAEFDGDCTSSEEGIASCPGDEGDQPGEPVPSDDGDAGGGFSPGADGDAPDGGPDAGAGGDDSGADSPGVDGGDADGGADSPGDDGGEAIETDIDGGTPASCLQDEFSPEAGLAADLLLVVDRSLSMEEVPEGSTETKWQQLTAVIGDVVWDLDQELGFGLSTFPGPVAGDLLCAEGSVVVEIDNSTAPAISFALLATSPNGGTPTAPTLRMALSYLGSRVSDRPQAVVLATDGAPNCNSALDPTACVCSQADCYGDEPRACLDDAEAVAATEELAQAGFATFVVGIPGSELFALVLDRMAVAGGTALQGNHRYYSTSSAAELESALRDIGQRVAECRFELSQEPQADSIAVTVDGSPVARDLGRSDGWDYVGARTVELFGPACEALAGGGQVVVVDYCGPG